MGQGETRPRGEITHVTENRKETDGKLAPSVLQFISERVAPLSRFFAETPLMQLRVRTSRYSIALVKTPGGVARRERGKPAQTGRVPRTALPPDGEPGRQYDVIAAEVVGIFRAATDLPEPGDRIDADRELGYVEALKLQTPVRSGAPCIFVAQVAEDGQAVEFGETLFVVDRTAAPAKLPEPPAPVAQATTDVAAEPPRM